MRPGEDQCPRWIVKQRAVFLYLFVLFRLSVNWMMPTHAKENHLLYPVHQFKCWSLLETPSQIYTEITFNQILSFPTWLRPSQVDTVLTITLSIPTSRWGANCRRAKGVDISYNAMWFCLLDQGVKIDKGLMTFSVGLWGEKQLKINNKGTGDPPFSY